MVRVAVPLLADRRPPLPGRRRSRQGLVGQEIVVLTAIAALDLEVGSRLQ